MARYGFQEQKKAPAAFQHGAFFVFADARRSGGVLAFLVEVRYEKKSFMRLVSLNFNDVS
ncbi:hypothetical protein ABE501_12125 [Comamonas testosteroni]